jgi:hypothetical protein
LDAKNAAKPNPRTRPTDTPIQDDIAIKQAFSYSKSRLSLQNAEESAIGWTSSETQFKSYIARMGFFTTDAVGAAYRICRRRNSRLNCKASALFKSLGELIHQRFQKV